jgi:hypothetical protein
LGIRHLERHLQHEGRLADARIAAYKNDRAGDDASAKDAGKLPDGQGQAIFRGSTNFG